MVNEDVLEGIPASLWRDAANAPHRLLLLDFDGSLAPFVVARGDARPDATSLAALRTIARSARTSVAIVSGRPVTELSRALGPLRATIVGEHGWERLGADSSLTQIPLPERLRALLQDAESRAAALGYGDWLERKRTSVVLHTRGRLADDAATAVSECIAAWTPALADGAATLDRIDGGVELRGRGRDKGVAVLELLHDSPPGTLPVYLGDDVTDEDAFVAIVGRGYGIRVGKPERTTAALGWLPGAEAMAAFLDRWIGSVETASGGEA